MTNTLLLLHSKIDQDIISTLQQRMGVRPGAHICNFSRTDDALQIIPARYTLRERKTGQVLIIIPIAASIIYSASSVLLKLRRYNLPFNNTVHNNPLSKLTQNCTRKTPQNVHLRSLDVDL
ncbi:hypothetical protein V1264_002197 [Littorina saxatilis]|uniref:Uncharacterized protein n=1 Tax=Littorina saxatilis TaxID=31220 RepID=A0AAN9C8V3_9CAEN